MLDHYENGCLLSGTGLVAFAQQSRTNSSCESAIVANCLVFLTGKVIVLFTSLETQLRNPHILLLAAPCYWGIARHCNYLGDLTLALSFSLPCGIRLDSKNIGIVLSEGNVDLGCLWDSFRGSQSN
ncbi:unnamed protein product [Microthlaspi erraticum]|uniref:Uncharacterized protein n=1 Tax=Microthlaspi erraticum TaxID=1685480 RepID=A0A6D2K2F3_9BRAS|nr:unnamed protein product [Microthlaspi erraticum]